MPIRLSGMQSGLDTEALVSALVMGYRTKKEDYEKAQTKLSWKQDKWKSINTKITNFYSGTLSSNRLTSAYNLKKATINNSSYATVSASTSAVSGTQSLKVTKLASTGYLTGGKISGSGSTKLTGSSKLSEVDGMGSAADGASISVTADGKTSTIDLSSDMTISQFVVKLKNAGLTASFDENNQRFFISSKSSGADNDFSMTAANSNGKNALGALKLQATTADTVAKDIAKYQTIAGTDKNTYIADTAKSNYDATIEQYNTAIEKLKTSNAELEEKNKKLAYQKQYVDSFIEKANYTGTGDGIYNPTTLDEARKYLSDRESELEAKKTDGTITDDEKLELEAVKTVSKTVSDDTLVFTRTQKTDDDGNVSYTSDVDSLLTSTEASITSNNETIAANNTSINQYYTEAGVDSTNAAQVDSTNGKILLSYSDAITGSNSLATGYQAAATMQYEYAVSMVEA